MSAPMQTRFFAPNRYCARRSVDGSNRCRSYSPQVPSITCNGRRSGQSLTAFAEITITDAVDRFDRIRTGLRFGDLAAQVLDVAVDRAVVDDAVILVNRIEQVRARQH